MYVCMYAYMYVDTPSDVVYALELVFQHENRTKMVNYKWIKRKEKNIVD